MQCTHHQVSIICVERVMSLKGSQICLYVWLILEIPGESRRPFRPYLIMVLRELRSQSTISPYEEEDLVPISLPSYLSFYQGGSRLRSCHLDKLSVVSSLIPISSQFSDRSNNPLSKSFFYRTHLLWNNLSLELRKILSPSLFKLEITKHLWNTLLTKDSSSSDDDFGWVLITIHQNFSFFLFFVTLISYHLHFPPHFSSQYTNLLWSINNLLWSKVFNFVI